MPPSPARYFNRELSWLEFNQRVLDEARDDSVPVLERLKFLAITASNLDEFFMVRVGGLQMLSQRRRTRPDPSGMTPKKQLAAISARTRQMNADQYACLGEELEPKLATAGIRRVAAEDLTDRQRSALEQLFTNELQAVLTPMAVSVEDEFPLLANQSLNVAVRLAPAPQDPELPRYAIIPIGPALSRFQTLPSDGGYSYMLIEDVVALFADLFFPGEDVRECVPFRITRNADMSVREDLAGDLLVGMEEVLDARRQSACVRLEVAADAGEELLSFLCGRLEVVRDNVFAAPGPLDLSSFMQVAGLPGFDNLQYEDWPPQPSPAVDLSASIFDVIADGDVLLYHPYESFEPVLKLINEAADDPDVLAVKQVLYRTSRNSPVVAALMRAAENGKYVTAIVELKARFDEARNIEGARQLEHAGAQVIYGVKGLKTHAKICIVVRREPHGIVRYLHFGTGNYNERTARLYSDVSFMTCDEELGADATNFFNAVTGYSQPQQFRKIEAAPTGLRDRLLEMIQAETQWRKQGQRAAITAKMNSLVDAKIIDALYEASQAGVKIQLNVRGICCLRPGVKGMSENIRVTSIVDRFLEHARIFCFLHGGDERVFISSADWMPRNLDRRVELLVPIESTAARDRLKAILETHFSDTVKARELRSDGSYVNVKPKSRKRAVRSQQALYQETVDAVRGAKQQRRTVLEPHRSPRQNG
ncbi:MAG: polyphosphate kinase 1 [Pirellulaceae bacterium]